MKPFYGSLTDKSFPTWGIRPTSGKWEKCQTSTFGKFKTLTNKPFELNRLYFCPCDNTNLYFQVNPASWMQMVTKHRATVAICKSRDLHWGLLATKDHRDLNLSSLRLLTVADGANPWSLSSCDQFLSVFQVSCIFYFLIIFSF